MEELTGGLKRAPKIKARCPTCVGRLAPMDQCGLAAVGVCPWCGELVRRTEDSVRRYTEAEERDAHPEILDKLKQVQAQVRSSSKPKTGA